MFMGQDYYSELQTVDGGTYDPSTGIFYPDIPAPSSGSSFDTGGILTTLSNIATSAYRAVSGAPMYPTAYPTGLGTVGGISISTILLIGAGFLLLSGRKK